MQLFIRIKDGQPFEHPILEENLRAAFPDVDVNNLPPEFARFERTALPNLGPYEVYEGAEYRLVNGVYTDFHLVRQMTGDEKVSKQNSVKLQWLEHGWPSWIFNEQTCSFDAPVPRPTDGKRYRWDEPTLSWVEIVLPE